MKPPGLSLAALSLLTVLTALGTSGCGNPADDVAPAKVSAPKVESPPKVESAATESHPAAAPTATAGSSAAPKELPKGAGSIVGMMLELAADESGRIVSCMESPPSRNDRGKHFPELAPVACEQVAKSVPIKPPFDPAGRPMRSIQTASVHFNLDH